MATSKLAQALSKADSIEFNLGEFIRHIDYDCQTNTLEFFSEEHDEKFTFCDSSIDKAVYDPELNEWTITGKYGVKHTIQLFIVKPMATKNQLPKVEKNKTPDHTFAEFLTTGLNGTIAADFISKHFEVSCSYIGKGIWEIDGNTLEEEDVSTMIVENVSNMPLAKYNNFMLHIFSFRSADINGGHRSFQAWYKA